MPRMFTRYGWSLLFLILISDSAHVFTGAQETQVNFTALIIDKHVADDTTIDEKLLRFHIHSKNSENASSIPDKHGMYSAYKEYVTPDKHFAVTLMPSREATN